MDNSKSWDWDEIQKDAGGQFSPFAKPGVHTAKIETIDVRETKNKEGNTSYWLDLIFVDEGTAYPKISHPISFKDPKGSWRKWHYMLMLKELGISEDKAKKAIEMAESKKGNENIVAAYHATFARAVEKHPEVEIEVYESDSINQKTGRPYLRADFRDTSLAFGRTSQPAKTESVIESGEEINLEQEDLSIPF